MYVASPRKRAPPPVSTSPVSARSATSSGLQCSITALMQLRIASTGPRSASRISSLVTTAFRGTPLIVSSPLTSVVSSCSSGKRAADFDLDVLGTLLADPQREVPLEVVDDRLVHFVAGDADRAADDDVGQAENGDVGRAAADVADHAGHRLGNRQPGADAGRLRLFQQVDASGSGPFGTVEDGPLFDRRDSARNGDHHARTQARPIGGSPCG